LELKNGAYEDFVVKITEGVPVKDCRIVLDNLEISAPNRNRGIGSLRQTSSPMHHICNPKIGGKYLVHPEAPATSLTHSQHGVPYRATKCIP
jgi:hypothetical protein